MFARLEAWFDMLFSDPIGFIVYAAYLAVTVLISLILHECAHGYVAWRCGDPTARMMGRLSLDPRKHLDPIGTVCMLLLGFGWAKPVPVNPRNFRNIRRDDFLVSIAGIVTNFALFLICVALSVGVNGIMFDREFLAEFGKTEALVSPYYTGGYSIMEGTASDALIACMNVPALRYVQRFLMMMAQINLSLAIFNLLPIPPLDGYHLLNDTILRGRFQLNRQMFQIAHIVLMVICFTGVLGRFLGEANSAIYQGVLGLMLKLTGGA